MGADIRIAAALILDCAGQTLLVRKQGTSAFQQAGGKIDPGEIPVTALIRELKEEIGLRVNPERLDPLGMFSAPAANEPGQQVVADVFCLRLLPGETIEAAAEIAEMRWVDPRSPGIELAPLTRDKLLPQAISLARNADRHGRG